MSIKIDSVCPYCKGEVIYTSNAYIYGGRTYGSGMCYVCTNCRASVGTHKPRPREPYGILATPEMQRLRKLCHAYFDKSWKTTPMKRNTAYKKLANKLNIPKEECHFGMFTEERLNQALLIIKEYDWWKK